MGNKIKEVKVKARHERQKIINIQQEQEQKRRLNEK